MRARRADAAVMALVDASVLAMQQRLLRGRVRRVYSVVHVALYRLRAAIAAEVTFRAALAVLQVRVLLVTVCAPCVCVCLCLCVFV